MVPTGLFDLTPKQHEHVAWVKQVATETLAPIAERGRSGHVDRELIRAMGDLGLLRRLFPGVTEAAGETSREAAALDLCLLREALATVSTEAETALALEGLG